MRKLNILFALALLLGLQSCNNYLDIKPKGIQIPEFYDDYVRLLNHKNLMSADNAYVNFLTDNVLLGENTLDFGRFDQADEGNQNLYTFASGAVRSSGTTDYFWENAYKRIYTFNVVINNASTCKDATEQAKQGLIAEAKVARAFEYLNLVNMYANHYDKATAATDFGVPILLSEDINKSYVRNTVQQVYDFILADIADAAPYVPEKPVNRFRTSQQFLNGFLAKVYLYMGEYKTSNEYAIKALKGNTDLLDYTRYEVNPAANGMGRIWNPKTKEQYPDINQNAESIYARSAEGVLGLSRNVYASANLLDLYKKDLPAGAVDKRRELYYADNSFKMYNAVYKFPGKSMFVAYIDVNGGLSVPDLYLMLAETYARLGDKDNALKYVNLLRDKRVKNHVHLQAASDKETLRMVLEERRREFAMFGSTRLIDLKRLNREPAFAKEIVHTIGNTERYTLPANDKRYILPLPPKVLGQNPSLPQYDR